MDRSAIPAILRELNIHPDLVACIYNYGSWVYGTNSATSDRDLMIVTRSSANVPLVFNDEFDYFHEFDLHKLWNQYDVCVHSVENFEVLLKKNYMLAIECVFLPAEFKIKEDINFQKIYLDKYYDPVRLKTVAFYENYISQKMYDLEDHTLYPLRSQEPDLDTESNRNFLFKNLFHGFRYLDFGQQLIESKSIQDFQRVSHVLGEMKQIRDNCDETYAWESVLEFVKAKSAEHKSQLDTLVPTNIVKGTFETHVTLDCSNNTEEVIEKLKKACENTKYKVIFIDLNSHNKKEKNQQLMTSSYHCGEYPAIVSEINEEVHKHFRDFNIVRVKIEALASNDGIPETDIEKKLFWDDKSNYFEFHYKVLLKIDNYGKAYKELENICNYSRGLHLSRNAFQRLNEDNSYYLITKRLFENGRKSAFEINDRTIDYLTARKYPPLKTVREFVVYDSFIELDKDWK
ncbi:unnamed protein product [Adineta ricciae]|uniref:Nucleotidyltransferase domain-containing protein n=1 Tax=Adineta ricciae TaxID=249248 RepID=A0A814H076_ADIRI|nr:unnamed protein product [Adineta ricciae]CAF1100835.1 unnamed protein product [Adineta ricciae]